jgi:hypothetical protein
MIFGFRLLFTSRKFEKTTELNGGYQRNFVREDNSSEKSNERLERNTVTSVSGKPKAEKNGWRNRMKQPT